MIYCTPISTQAGSIDLARAQESCATRDSAAIHTAAVYFQRTAAWITGATHSGVDYTSVYRSFGNLDSLLAYASNTSQKNAYCNHIGLLFLRNGITGEARRYLERSYRLGKGSDDPTVHHSTVNALASISLAQGDTCKAERLLAEARALPSPRNTTAAAHTLKLSGDLLASRQQHDTAAALYATAIEILRNQSDNDALLRTYTALFNIDIARHDAPAALAHATALAETQTAQKATLADNARRALLAAEARLVFAEHPDVCRLITEIATIDERPWPLELRICYHDLLGRLYKRNGEYRHGLRHVLRAAELADSSWTLEREHFARAIPVIGRRTAEAEIRAARNFFAIPQHVIVFPVIALLAGALAAVIVVNRRKQRNLDAAEQKNAELEARLQKTTKDARDAQATTQRTEPATSNQQIEPQGISTQGITTSTVALREITDLSVVARDALRHVKELTAGASCPISIFDFAPLPAGRALWSNPSTLRAALNAMASAFLVDFGGEITKIGFQYPGNNARFFVTGKADIPAEAAKAIARCQDTTEPRTVSNQQTLEQHSPALLVSCQAIKKLGTRIMLSHNDNGQTTLYFELQLRNAENTPAPNPGLPNWDGRHILVAEDDYINYEIIKGLIKPTQARVSHARNGQEVMKQLEARSFDAIIMDLKMPKMDGIESINLINKQMPKHPPIIAQTAHMQDSERESLVEMGFVDLLMKPIHRQKLYKTLELLFLAKS